MAGQGKSLIMEQGINKPQNTEKPNQQEKNKKKATQKQPKSWNEKIKIQQPSSFSLF